MYAVCDIPFVEHGEVTLLEGGRKAVTRCYDGYHHTSGDSMRICNVVNGTWSGDTIICQLLPGLSSTKIMLLIIGPIILFFVVCLPIDYYFFKKRKQESREQQGMVYHRELRRVGMTRASMEGTLEEPDPRPSGAFGSLRNHITRFKSLIGILSLKRKVTGSGVDQENPKQEKEVEENENSGPKSDLDIIAESESETESESSSVSTDRGIRPILNRVTDIKGVLAGNEPVILKVCPTEQAIKTGQAPVMAKLPPINQVHPVEEKRQLYAMKTRSYQNLASGEKCVTEPIPVPLGRSVHI